MSPLENLSRTAYIFDKDGTLLDTESVWFEGYDRLLRLYGARHDAETHAKMMGAGADVCAEILQARHASLPQGKENIPFLIDECYRFFHQVRDEKGANPFPGVEVFLERCKNQGIPLAIATSARSEEADSELETLGWKKFFVTIVTADDVENHKPAPDIYLEAARRLGVNPVTCVAFEDGLRGIQSAHAAGMKVVFVQDTRFTKNVPKEASLTIQSFEELLG